MFNVPAKKPHQQITAWKIQVIPGQVWSMLFETWLLCYNSKKSTSSNKLEQGGLPGQNDWFDYLDKFNLM